MVMMTPATCFIPIVPRNDEVGTERSSTVMILRVYMSWCAQGGPVCDTTNSNEEVEDWVRAISEIRSNRTQERSYPFTNSHSLDCDFADALKLL